MEDMITVTVKCRICWKDIALKVRREDWREFNRPERRNIQDVFPYLSPAERELLLSGTCESCWNDMFAFEREDDCEAKEACHG